MLKNSRVTGALDTTRLGAALARPGMDTRTWVSLAIVKAITIDPTEGVFVDVICYPNKNPGTARLGCVYAGNGFGLYAPVMVDDEVLVEAPNGNPDQGLVVTQRLHSPSDPLPEEVGAHPEDFLLIARPGKIVRIMVAGNTDQVQIYRRGGTPRRLAFKDELDALANHVDNHFHQVGGVTAGGTTVPSGIPTTSSPAAVGTDVLRAQ